jgi:hypothetical protein
MQFLLIVAGIWLISALIAGGILYCCFAINPREDD